MGVCSSTSTTTDETEGSAPRLQRVTSPTRDQRHHNQPLQPMAIVLSQPGSDGDFESPHTNSSSSVLGPMHTPQTFHTPSINRHS